MLLSPRLTRPDQYRPDERRVVLERSDLFDPTWYLARYPDVGLLGLDPLDHYLRIGSLIGRNPSARFDARWYLQQNPSVAEARLDPLFHYLKWGRDQGWKIRAVGKRFPAVEHARGRRGVKRKLPVWDQEREANFLDFIKIVYARRKQAIDAVDISIVMPTYNRAESIGHAIASVLSQSHSNWTLAVADDGSDDATAEVMQRFLADRRVRFLPGERRGVSAARNRALAAAGGRYVFYLDSDNSWRPDFVRTMVTFMESGQLAAAYSGAICHVDPGSDPYFRGDDFIWAACLEQNYVDMNCFAHRRELVGRCGPFDEALRRLVDWELILRYTLRERTAFAPFIGVDYDDTTRGHRITHSEYRRREELAGLAEQIRSRHRSLQDTDPEHLRPTAEALLGSEARAAATSSSAACSRIAYVLWDWPALSQTFVLNEIRELLRRGHDVRVYYRVPAEQSAHLDFEVDSQLVEDATHLSRLLQRDRREVMHAPFVYPAGTLLAWPASQATGIPFTLMAGGVDVTHEKNVERNRVAEMAADPLCLGLVTLGSFHRDFLLDRGVPSNKLVLERQAVALHTFQPNPGPGAQRPRPRVLAIGRFIEKKGFEYLIRAAARHPQADFVIHGYGPLEAELHALIVELGASNVELRGPLPDAAALRDAYLGADVFALPCVRAGNGDLDGMPTVLLEAMMAGVPVVSTDLANIPDLVIDGATGALCRARDVDALAEALGRMLNLDPSERTRMVESARMRVRGFAHVGRTTDTLSYVWSRQQLDIVLVTYDTERCDNIEDTLEIVERIYRFTATPFRLLIADNASRPEFRRELRHRFGDRPSFELIELEQNVFCGPASNEAIGRGNSPYIIYVCSKEGFLLRHGWERQMVRSLEANPRAAMAGHLVPLARFPTFGDLQNYPSFADWRGREFAMENSDLPFRHVQGGLFILRRTAFEASGGFNPLTPQDGMDVEYSYRLQTMGYELASVAGLAAITTKTRPTLISLVDEFSFAVHPSSAVEVGKLDALVGRSIRLCALCGWQGNSFVASDRCPSCGSSPFSRAAYRLLSESGWLQTKPRVLGMLSELSLREALSPLCPLIDLHVLPQDAGADQQSAIVSSLLPSGAGTVAVFEAARGDAVWGPALEVFGNAVRTGANVIVGARSSSDISALKALAEHMIGAGLHARGHRLISTVCGLSGDLLFAFSRHPVPHSVQALDC